MRILRWFGFLFILLALLPVLAITFFGEPIARSVVSALNGQLQGEVTIEEYDVGFWRTFPDLSVGLRGAQVQGADGSDLLTAGRIDLLLDVGSLFGKIRVAEIVVRDGRLQLLTDADGTANFQLTADPVGDAGGEPAEFALGQAVLQDVVLIVHDRQLDVDWEGKVEALNLTGDFAADTYLLAADGSVYLDYLSQGGDRYAEQQRLELNARTKVDRTTNLYTFAPLNLSAGALDLEVVGTLRSGPAGLGTDLHVKSTSGNLADVLALIPPAFAGSLADLETRGELDLSATVTGDWTTSNYPRIEGQLNYTGGRVGSPRVNLGVRDLNLRATFTYLEGPRGGIQSFSVDELTGKFRNQPFRMTLLVEDLDNPRVRFEADGAYDLKTIPALLDASPVTDADGYARFDKVRIEGLYADMVQPRTMGNVNASGRILLDGGELTLNGRDLFLPTGTLELDRSEARLTDLVVRTGETDLLVSGRATNFLPVLLADSLNSRDAELRFSAELTGTSLNLDELLELGAPEPIDADTDESASGTADSLRARTVANRTRISDLLRGTISARLDGWAYGEIRGRDFTGQLDCTPGGLHLQGLTEAMGGELQLDGTVAIGERLGIRGWVAGGGIDVETFFRQGENFAQEVVTADNLRGTMDARLWIESAFDAVGNFDYPALRVLADLRIRDGELHDFPLLENFAFALKSGDLERVRFTELDNYFEIADETLYLPAMNIRSSALNLVLAGEHTFDQQLDYHVMVNAGQAIANKIARHDEDLEVLPERRGWFNLYYRIHGPVETFAVDRDKRGAKNRFAAGAERRERIRRELERHLDGATILVEDAAGAMFR